MDRRSQGRAASQQLPMKLIRFKSRQLVGKYGFTESDRPDIEQDLVADLVKRLPEFNPSLSGLHTFLEMVIDHGVATLIQRRRRQCRDWRRRTVSFDETTHSSGDGGDESDRRDLKHDLESAAENLPDELFVFYAFLQHCSVSELARVMQSDRSRARTKVARLRKHFADAGLEKYL